MTLFMRTASQLLIPFFVLMAFAMGVFFRGLDEVLFAPALFCVVIAALMLLRPGFVRSWSFPADGASVFLALFWFWMVIALSWSHVPAISCIFTILIGSLPLLYFSLTQHDDADLMIRRTGAGLAVLVALLAVWVLVQFMVLTDLVDSRIRHPMLNPNNLAVVLALGVFLMAQIFMRTGLVMRGVIGVAMIIGVVAVLLTQSRGGVLGLAVGLAVVAITCFPALKSGIRLAGWKVYCILGSILTLGALFMLGVMAVRGYDFHLLAGGLASISVRFVLWGASLQMMFDHPFPGVGLGVFYLVYPPYRREMDDSDGYFVHMDPLQFGIEMGILAPILFYAFAIAVLLRTIRAVSATPPGDPRRLALMIPFAGLMSLLVNAHVNFDLYMLPGIVIAAVMLAAWYRAGESILGPRRITLSLADFPARVFLVPALILLFVLAPVWLVRAGVAVQSINSSAMAMARGDMGTARDLIDRAIVYGPPDYYRTTYMDAQWYGKMLQDNFMSFSATERADYYAAFNHAAAETMRLNPYYSYALNYFALIQYIAYPRIDPRGRDKAQATLESALVLDPLNFDVRMGLSKLYADRGAPRRAVDVLTGILDWDVARQYAPPVYRNMIVDAMKVAGDPRLAEFSEQTKTMNEALKDRAQIRYRLENWLYDRWAIAKAKLGY